MCDICHVIGGGTYMVSDLDNILHVITKDNGFSKLYNFLKHNYFAYEPITIDLIITS
jgi:hypothetical protein